MESRLLRQKPSGFQISLVLLFVCTVVIGTATVVNATDGSRVRNGITPVEPGGDEQPGDRVSLEAGRVLTPEEVAEAIESPVIKAQFAAIVADPHAWGCLRPNGDVHTIYVTPASKEALAGAVDTFDPTKLKLPGGKKIPADCVPLDGQDIDVADLSGGSISQEVDK